MSNNVVNFTINLDGNAYKGILQVNDALDDVLVNAKQVKQSFSDWTKDFMGLDALTNLVGKVSQAFQSMVGSSLDFEQQQANMRTLLNGDAEATDNLIGKIREYGKATVYDRSGLIEAQKTMMAFGLDAEYAFGKLKNIGDIALGDKQKMQSLALAFSQMSSTGKLMGQDLLQMINAGFNPLEVISQKTGRSIAELKEAMGKGAISAEMVAQAFEWATEEGGRFYQGAETAAQTTAGKIAKMKDQIDDFKISLFEWSHGATAWAAELGNMFVPLSQAMPLFKGLYNISATTFKHLKALDFAGVLGGIGRKATEARISLAFMRKDIETCSMASLGFVRNTVRATMAVGRFATVGLFNAVKGMGAYLLSLVTGGAASRTFANVATASFAKFALSAKAACKAVGVAVTSIPIVGWIAAAVAAVIGLVTLLWNKSEGFRRVVFGTWEAVKAAVSNAWQYVKTAAQVTWEVLKRVFDRLKESLSGLWERIKDLFTRLKAALAEAWNRIKPVLKNIADKVWDAVKVVMKVVAVVTSVVAAVIAAVGLLAKAVWDNLLKPLFQRLFSIVSTVVSHVASAVGDIVSFMTSIPEKISTALDNVRTFFSDLWSSVAGTVRNAVDRITDFVASIPEKTSSAFDNVRVFFADAWSSVTGTVRNAVDRITGFVTSISERISTALESVREFFARVWDSITEKVRGCIDRITGFVAAIPRRAADGLDNVRAFFADAWSSVTGTVRNAVDRITGFVTSIPERISTALESVREFFARVWDSITEKVRSCIDRIKELVEELRAFVTETFAKAGDFIAGVWERVTEAVGSAVDWIADKLGRIAGWVKTKMVDPIKNAFTGMWDVIRDVFDKILTKLGRLFAPIRELWNKLFPKDKMKDVRLAYGEGTDKGTKSWERSKGKGDVDTGKEAIVLDGKDGLDGLAGVNGKSGKDGKLSDGTLGKNAGTVAGKAQQITIKLESMVGTMNFNGGLRDNASNVESTLAEMMARILGMAETAV